MQHLAALIIISIIKHNKKFLPTKKSKLFQNMGKNFFFDSFLNNSDIFLRQKHVSSDVIFLLSKVCNNSFNQRNKIT